MPEIPVAVDARHDLGSPASRRMRRAGRIPAVVYGHGLDPLSISVDARALRTALSSEAGTNALLRLELGSEQHLVLAREIQRHPVRHTVSHVDFLVVRRDEIVHTEVQISLVGESVAVHRAEGTIGQEFFTLEVKAKPADLPSNIEIDISSLEIGQQIRVGDLVLPPGVTTDLDPEMALVVAHPPRVRAEDLEAAEAGEEGEEGGEPGAATADGAAGASAAESSES